MADLDELLARLAEDLGQTLGGELLSLAVHGSFALGDFTPSRSDLDLLAVLGADPTSATFAALHEVHARLATDFPGWGSRLDVEYVSVDATEAVVQSTAGSHQMVRIGGGEPLHDVDASRHYVLNWAAALQADRPIAGAAPSAVLPAIDQRLVQQVVVQHVRGWSQWVAEMHTRADRPTPCSPSAVPRRRWRPDARYPSWQPPTRAGRGSRSGPISSNGPEPGGTTADPTKITAGRKMCADSSTTSAKGCCGSTTVRPRRDPRTQLIQPCCIADIVAPARFVTPSFR